MTLIVALNCSFKKHASALPQSRSKIVGQCKFDCREPNGHTMADYIGNYFYLIVAR